MQDEPEQPARAGQVEPTVRPRAWLRVSNISGTARGVFETQDVELQSERLEPLYDSAAVAAVVNQYADDERNQAELRWSSRVDGLTAQLRETEARYMTLLKAVADGVAMQPRTVMLDLGPNVLSAPSPENMPHK